MEIKNIVREEKGSTIVLISIMATVLLAVTALVVDYGMLTVFKQRLEYNTDTAALAGAQELPRAEAAIAKATEYAEKNGLDNSNLTITVSSDLKSVAVSAYIERPLNFARVFKREKAILTGSSRARLAPVSRVWGAVPLGIDERPLVFGQKVSLKVAPENNQDYLLGSGNYGILALTGPGASNYENDLKNGFKGWLKIGDVVETQTGNISGKTQSGISYRVSECKHNPPCTPQSFARDCTRVVFVPVYTINSVQNNNQVKNVKITGFAAFFIDEYVGTGNDNFVNGYFVRKVEPGELDHNAPDYGVNVVRLTSW